MDVDLLRLDLEPALFEEIRRLLYGTCGINLGEDKAGLVKARLLKRLRALDIPSFAAYMRHVREDASGAEMTALVDVLTTNKTSFFRESQHFDYLRESVLPGLRESGRVRFWSAGCSSGEEPYSLAILMREEIPDLDRLDTRILATDLSTRILATARAGVYETDRVSDMDPALVARYFEAVSDRSGRAFRVRDHVRRMVSLAHLNLLHPWPMQGPFDVIFCRNVMIYFDRPTQQRLVERFAALLRPGGLLFVGHSESLTSLSNTVRYVRPAVYAKC